MTNNTFTFTLDGNKIEREIVTELKKFGVTTDTGQWVKVANVYIPIDELEEEYDRNATEWIKDHLK